MDEWGRTASAEGPKELETAPAEGMFGVSGQGDGPGAGARSGSGAVRAERGFSRPARAVHAGALRFGDTGSAVLIGEIAPVVGSTGR
ncbi:hypothetical protein D1871_08080 [Nakamurella silvestris]|nr:hypothetical protein D1871_08080 [Nakamurella silvestris]